jgi:hypothetical protein
MLTTQQLNQFVRLNAKALQQAKLTQPDANTLVYRTQLKGLPQKGKVDLEYTVQPQYTGMPQLPEPPSSRITGTFSQPGQPLMGMFELYTWPHNGANLSGITLGPTLRKGPLRKLVDVISAQLAQTTQVPNKVGLFGITTALPAHLKAGYKFVGANPYETPKLKALLNRLQQGQHISTPVLQYLGPQEMRLSLPVVKQYQALPSVLPQTAINALKKAP